LQNKQTPNPDKPQGNDRQQHLQELLSRKLAEMEQPQGPTISQPVSDSEASSHSQEGRANRASASSAAATEGTGAFSAEGSSFALGNNEGRTFFRAADTPAEGTHFTAEGTGYAAPNEGRIGSAGLTDLARLFQAAKIDHATAKADYRVEIQTDTQSQAQQADRVAAEHQEGTPAAAELRARLRSPAGAREAFLASEIFARRQPRR
jgi:hypothetical protein